MRRVGAMVLMVAVAGAAPQAKTKPDPRVEQARAALMPLKKGLKGALQAAMKAKGPVGAIEACHERAAGITEGASAGVKVGRTSHRLRNPRNAPAPWMQAPLVELQKAPPKVGDFRTVALPDGALGYVEPIRVGAVCLGCHGGEIAPAVREKLRALYPTDAATGFTQGTFRGLFWAVVPPAK